MSKFISGVVGEYLAREFNGRFTYALTTVTLNSVSTSLLKNDPERVFTMIVNTGGTPVNLSFNTIGPAGTGIILAPGGGMIAFNAIDDFILPSLPLFAASQSSSNPITIVSVRRYSPGDMGEPKNAI